MPVPQWYWKVSAWTVADGEAEWLLFSDVEQELIEQAYVGGEKQVELDHYIIDFEKLIQMRKSDETKQRNIKRIFIDHKPLILRQERFFITQKLSSDKSSFGDAWRFDDSEFIQLWAQQFTHQHYYKTGKTHKQLDDVLTVEIIIDLAADGILAEGEELAQKYAAESLAQELKNVIGQDLNGIYECCLRLYTRTGFLCQLINRTLREDDLSKLNTLGPYCYLLYKSTVERQSKHTLPVSSILYRGALLDYEQIESYRSSVGRLRSWLGFSSTTKN
ncbi:unnamed protein product [Didymodactylos carnosus]|uniref:WWE domain-containing protein n=1 Tax=Didymodactylos carnosus TaxID=1234261 RepID=A0A814MKM0_9BILA|nr:unnamed protein product [Didymodactylos carnosus]CAF1089461.1 unnamed protein product [Didymodactylos carnosus]CAF3846311.1 unnamed protein product [Didymodactylos carnosus]CAF3851147.1 unnamed protein product [Didymodactylos carnosus]